MLFRSVGLRQNTAHRRCNLHPLMAVPAGILQVHMLLDPDLRRLVVIALAPSLTPNALLRPTHALVLVGAPFLLLGQIVEDLHPRQVCGDGFTTAAMGALLAFVGGHGRGPLCLGRFRRLDRGKHLSLVEQHLLIR